MAERSGFFDALNLGTEQEPVWDRAFLAEAFAHYFSLFLSNGVYPNPPNQLRVISTGAFGINLTAGDAFSNGYFYTNTDNLPFVIDPPTGGMDRIDRLILRWGKVERTITSMILKGTPSLASIPPTLTRNADYYDISLAYVRIGRTATQITQANIIDERANNEVCGFVHGLIEQIDTTTLFEQMQADWGEFKDITQQTFDDYFVQLQRLVDELLAGEAVMFKDEYDVGREVLNAGGIKPYVDSIEMDLSQEVTNLANGLDPASDVRNAGGIPSWTTGQVNTSAVSTLATVRGELDSTGEVRSIGGIKPYIDARQRANAVMSSGRLTVTSIRPQSATHYEVFFQLPIGYVESSTITVDGSTKTVKNSSGETIQLQGSAGNLVSILVGSNVVFPRSGNAAFRPVEVYSVTSVANLPGGVREGTIAFVRSPVLSFTAPAYYSPITPATSVSSANRPWINISYPTSFAGTQRYSTSQNLRLPVSGASLYSGSAWIFYDAYVYNSGTWNQFSWFFDGYWLRNSTIKSGTSVSGQNWTWGNGGLYITNDGNAGSYDHWQGVYFTPAIDMTPFRELQVTYSAGIWASTETRLGFGLTTNLGMNHTFTSGGYSTHNSTGANIPVTTRNIDITNINSQQYFKFVSWSNYIYQDSTLLTVRLIYK